MLYKSTLNNITGTKTLQAVKFDQEITSSGSVNGVDGENLVHLADTKTMMGNFIFSEASVNSLQINGNIDDISWDSLLNSLFFKDVEQTVSSIFTFQHPTVLKFQGSIVGPSQDSTEDEYLNDQRVESLLDVEGIWRAMSAAKLSAQVESNIVCQHVNNLNEAYLENMNVDFYELLGVSQTVNFEGANREVASFELNGNVYLAALDDSSLKVMRERINLHSAGTDFPSFTTIPLNTFDSGAVTNPRNLEVIPWTPMFNGTESVGLSIVTDQRLITFSVMEGLSELEIQRIDELERVSPLELLPHTFGINYVDEKIFTARQEERSNGKFRISIHDQSFTDGVARGLWEGDEYAQKIAAPRLDVLRAGDQLHVAFSNHVEDLAEHYVSLLLVTIAHRPDTRPQLTVANHTKVRVAGPEFVLLSAHGNIFIIAAGTDEVRVGMMMV